jgi:hypothetical protein
MSDSESSVESFGSEGELEVNSEGKETSSPQLDHVAEDNKGSEEKEFEKSTDKKEETTSVKQESIDESDLGTLTASSKSKETTFGESSSSKSESPPSSTHTGVTPTPSVSADTDSSGSNLDTTSNDASTNTSSVGLSTNNSSNITNESLSGMQPTGNRTMKKDKTILHDGTVQTKETVVEVRVKNGKKYQVKTTTTKIKKGSSSPSVSGKKANQGTNKTFDVQSLLRAVSYPRNGGNVSFTDPWTNRRVSLPRPKTPKPRRA